MKCFDRIAVRRYTSAAVILLAVLAWPSDGWSRTTGRACNVTHVVKVLLRNWADTLERSWKDNNPNLIVDKYQAGAVLLPTCANGPLIGRAQIKGYFRKFLERQTGRRRDRRADRRRQLQRALWLRALHLQTERRHGRAAAGPLHLYLSTDRPSVVAGHATPLLAGTGNNGRGGVRVCAPLEMMGAKAAVSKPLPHKGVGLLSAPTSPG